MINTQMMEHAIKLAIISTSIEGERPVSILLIAPVEHGKTEVLKKFAFVKEVALTSDFNTYIFSSICNEYMAGKTRTIIIPDFLRVVKKKYSTQSNSLTIMNAVTEEGWIGQLPNGMMIQEPIIMNIITAITGTEMKDKRHKWTQLGFLSRFIPLSFSYKEDTKQEIRNYIKNRVYKTDENYKIIIPEKKVKVTLAREFADELEILSLEIAEQNNLTGFRLQRQLQTFAMASALSNSRDVVTKADVDTIKEIAKFINFDFTKI